MNDTINPQQVRQSANEIRQGVSNISNILDEARTIFKDTAHYYESEAADSIRNKFTNLSAKFGDFENAILEYAKFLEGVAERYEMDEAQVKKAAEEMLTDNYNG